MLFLGRSGLFAFCQTRQRPRLRPKRKAWLFARYRRRRRWWWRWFFRQRLAFDEQLQFGRVEHFALKQGVRHAFERVAVRFQDVARLRIAGVDDAADLGVDFDRRIFGVVAMLRDFAAEENLLFLFPERQRTQRAHTPFADHLACNFSGTLDVVTCARGDVVQEDFLRGAAAHQDGELRFEEVFRVRMLIVNWQLHRNT